MKISGTGVQYEIAAGEFTAAVTEIGAGLRFLRRAGRPLVMEFPGDGEPVGASGQLLIPWPNRIDGGRYTFGGVEQQLEITEPANDNAIHGLTRGLPWSLVSRTASAVLLTVRLGEHPGYPHELDLTAEYVLDETRGLTVSVTAVNVGESAAPYGIGSHAYLQVEGGLDGAVLRAPAARWLPVDERMLPVGVEPVDGTDFDFREGRALKGVTLDTAFTGLQRDGHGRVLVSLGGADGSSDGTSDGGADGGVSMWFGEGLDWVQLFSGDPLAEPHRRSALAVEPMSCPANAFVSGDGLIRLEPAASVTHTWGISG